jgi:hypothetical protein
MCKTILTEGPFGGVKTLVFCAGQNAFCPKKSWTSARGLGKIGSNHMPLLQRLCKTLGILSLTLLVPGMALGQSGYVTQAGEYAPAGNLPGDQTRPQLSLTRTNGFIVWQDNVTDGDGLGISTRALDSSFSSPFAGFRVNQQGAGDQENPQVTMLNNGGAAFTWQGGRQSFQHIYARFLSSSNTWVTGDVMVNASTNYYQINPVIATLANGNVIVVWSSYGQDGSMQGVYAQQFSPGGQKIGGESPVNQFTSFNQRTPAVAALSGGGYVIVWVSEQERSAIDINGNGYASVDIYGRIYNSSSTPLGNEFLVNTDTNICANPAVVGASDGTFIIAWGQKDTAVPNNGWDIFARPFSSAGNGGATRLVNTQRYGDQFAPKISANGVDYLAVWTSMGQDGSREGVYGQFLRGDASHAGGELRVNTTVLNQQINPAVASDNSGRFLTVWSSYTGLNNTMDLYAQRYVNSQQPLSPPGAPFVAALDSGSLSVSWPPVSGFNVVNYDLYVDGSGSPNLMTNNLWTVTGLAPGSSHLFRLSYTLSDGRVSPLSTPATGTTWGVDNNGDGLPDDWQALYWGANPANWPAPNQQLGPGGPTVLTVFEWGANPLNPGTWLKQQLTRTAQGWFLSWNTVPGFVYQVQTSANMANWTNLGALRYAAGATDSIFVGMGDQRGIYRIERVRY